jgi:ubiquinone biosynthesis protein COQ4
MCMGWSQRFVSFVIRTSSIRFSRSLTTWRSPRCSTRSSPSFPKRPKRRVLSKRGRVGTIDLHALAAYPEGTLGRVYGEHMLRNKLDPSAIPNLPSTTSREFLRAHLYETHDIWHVATGFATDVAGELGLQAFYLAQLPTRLAPALLAGGLFNTMLFAWGDRDRRMRAIVRGWLLGRRARSLFGVAWAGEWSTPLAEIRSRLRLETDAIESALVSFDGPELQAA